MSKTANPEQVAWYKCNKCGVIHVRPSGKYWMNSYCDKTGQKARLYKVD